ncbi:MAG: hypothetical protein QG639_960, partial [Patescibacteria group bacterium]|nr:hypothetical protein [Patescibacteria group bacterium]
TFKSSHLHLNVTKGAWTNEFKEQFGPPIYESTAANGIMSYSLIFTTTAPTNNTINWTVLPTEGVGNQPTNTKTVADLVKWVDGKKAAGVTIPFEIKTTLESEKDGQTVLNDSITVASNGFKPKFVTNECGTPPPTTPPPTGGGTVPACVSIQMQNTDNQPITNPAGLKPGDRVKFMCGPVAGVNKYVFRVMLFNEQGGQAGTTPLSPESPNSNKSAIFTIPDQGGRFTAQCAICPDGTCQAYDIDNYTPGNNTGAGTTACPAQYSCVSQAGCLETATGNYACPVSGQVCCANRRRDE